MITVLKKLYQFAGDEQKNINKSIFWGFFYALITTAIGYIFYYEGLKHITESSKVPVIASVEVIVASLIGVVWYREHLGFISFLGIVAAESL